MKKFENHPCFNPDAKGKFGRVHLPVAPRCNVQCAFCNRKFDCVNESRPGVTSNLLTPHQAAHYVGELLKGGKPISVAGIAGPGDPFANPDETMKTMRLLRKNFPDILLCVSSNGLGILPYIPELARIGVSHVTITISTLDAETGAKLYRWVRDDKKVKRGLDGAELMIDRQLEAVKVLKEHDIVVKVNSILIPGLNDSGNGSVVKVAEMCQAKGVDLHNIIPLCPVEGTDFADIEEPSSETVDSLRAICGEMVTQMTHCQRCRADACGTLCEGTSQQTMNLLNRISNGPARPGEIRNRVAVATREGILVNLHLGEAEKFYVFDPEDSTSSIFEIRKAPPAGSGSLRWEELAHTLQDCKTILVASAGPKPCDILLQRGLKVTIMEGLISEALDSLRSGKKIKAPVRTFKCGAGVSCGGDGSGC